LVLTRFGGGGLGTASPLQSRFSSSSFVQDSRSQQIKIGSSVHLPLQHFKSIDLALYLAITPRRAESL
jgi:hypothetical protein